MSDVVQQAETLDPQMELDKKEVKVEDKPEIGVKWAEVEMGGDEGGPPSEPLTDTTTDTPSFKEDSYKVGDLKESEKKALEAFRFKLEDALKTKTFFKKGEEEEKDEEKKDDEGGKRAETKEEKPERKQVEEGKVVVEQMVSVKNDEEGKEKIENGISEREVVLDASPPPPVAEGPKEFYMWGVPIHDAGDERTDVVLLKFLRARDFKVEEAFSMLKGTLAWRRELGLDKESPAEVRDEGKRCEVAEPTEGKDSQDAKEKKKEETDEVAFFELVAYIHGVGKEGHPVCYDEYGALQSKEYCGDEAKVERFFKWHIEMLERAIPSSLDFSPGGVHSMIQVVDLRHNPFFSKGRHITRKALGLLQENYPELVYKQIILNIPWFSFVTWYIAFGSTFTPRMRQKLVLVKPGKTAETLFKFIAPDQVPLKYGGLSRVGDTEFEGVGAPVSELVLKPGTKQTIEFPVEEAGTMLVWDVSVVGWDVMYGEEFHPSDEKSYEIIIHKLKKLSPGSEAIRNSFKVNEGGRVVITIDNSSSKKKKLVLSRSTIKKA